jgi:hypothetical protein
VLSNVIGYFKLAFDITVFIDFEALFILFRVTPSFVTLFPCLLINNGFIKFGHISSNLYFSNMTLIFKSMKNILLDL